MSRTVEHRRRIAGAALLVATTMGLAGCGGNPLSHEVIPAAEVSTAAATPQAADVPAPALTVADGADQKAWRPDQPIVVNAVQGDLDEVTVTSTAGTALAGTLSDDRQHWQSTGTLLPATTYKVRATMSGTQGAATETLKITTIDSAAPFQALVSPRDGGTVGVGMPILVTFTSPVADDRRADVERALTVTSSKPVEGAWNWVSDTKVQYRTKEYWPAHAKVSVKLDLAGLQVGDDVWGDQDKTVDFSIGRSVVSVVDVTAHEMTVTIDGEKARTIPVTTGKEGFRTRGGTRVISEMLESTRMDAASTGTDPGDPEYYNLAVKYAMRMTNSGEFIHAAPWSVAAQGHDNVSHGCVGMSTANAQWLFDRSRVGDVVTVVHSDRKLEQGNGLTQWNVSWEDWKAGSALAG